MGADAAARGLPEVRLTTLALIENSPPPRASLWLDAGDHEWLARPNDRLAELMARLGWDVRYQRQHGGHNQASWAEALVDALPAMFGRAGA